MRQPPRENRGGNVAIRVVNRADPRPEFDPWYLATVPGALKVVQAICSLVAFVCVVMINGAFEGTYIVAFIAVAGFTISLILLIMYLFNLVQLLPCNWSLTELVFDGVWCLLYLISTALMMFSAIRWTLYSAPWGAAAFFCLVAAVIHGVNFYLLIKARRLRQSQPKQQKENRPLADPPPPSYTEATSPAPRAPFSPQYYPPAHQPQSFQQPPTTHFTYPSTPPRPAAQNPNPRTTPQRQKSGPVRTMV